MALKHAGLGESCTLAMDAETGQAVAAALTTIDVDDGSQVGRSLDEVTAQVALFTTDGAHEQKVFLPHSPSVIRARWSSWRQLRDRAKRGGRARQHSGIAICRASPSTEEQHGRRHSASGSEPVSMPPLVGSSR